MRLKMRCARQCNELWKLWIQSLWIRWGWEYLEFLATCAQFGKHNPVKLQIHLMTAKFIIRRQLLQLIQCTSFLSFSKGKSAEKSTGQKCPSFTTPFITPPLLLSCRADFRGGIMPISFPIQMSSTKPVRDGDAYSPDNITATKTMEHVDLTQAPTFREASRVHVQYYCCLVEHISQSAELELDFLHQFAMNRTSCYNYLWRRWVEIPAQGGSVNIFACHFLRHSQKLYLVALESIFHELYDKKNPN